MSAALRRVEQRDFEVRVAVATNDELGYLGEHFNAWRRACSRANCCATCSTSTSAPKWRAKPSSTVRSWAAIGGVQRAVLGHPQLHGPVGNLPPAQLIELLNRYMSAMVDVVIAHGGIVNKFGGDSLLAVFGTPLNPIESMRPPHPIGIGDAGRTRSL